MSMITPKTIVITAYPGKHGNMTSRTPEISLLDSTNVSFDDGGGPKKRRRLTHLSPDEKLLRRKLKNRVAAQTARDRKKQLMSELEEKVAQLEEENKTLRIQNLTLKEASGTLIKENEALRSRLIDTPVSTIKAESGTLRSAAPAVPLQKEQVQNLSRWMEQYLAFVMMISLMISSACFKSIQPLGESVSSSRKRKQLHPARRVSLEEEDVQKVPAVIKQEPTQWPPSESPVAAVKVERWWGAHQQSWNPSMN